MPFGDVLLHAGDFKEHGGSHKVDKFCDWMSRQPHARKILIAGNHDLTLHDAAYEQATLVGKLGWTCMHVTCSSPTDRGHSGWGAGSRSNVNADNTTRPTPS